MFLAKVTGAVVATQKVPAMTGYKLLIVEPYRLEAEKRESLTTTGRTFVAVDTLGAGTGEFVLITQGSSARLTPETKNLPIDTVIVGIVDSVYVGECCVFSHDQTTPDGASSNPDSSPAPNETEPAKQTRPVKKTRGTQK